MCTLPFCFRNIACLVIVAFPCFVSPLLDSAYAQTGSGNGPAPRAVTGSAPSDILPAQRIGPDDLLSIQVSDVPELSRTFRVSSDGTLRLPLLAHRIQASGRMPVDLENTLTEELKTAGILVDPIVSIGVLDYRSRPVSVVGAVKSPLTFQAMNDSTLLDAIAKAGGLNPEAGSEILVTRKMVKSDGSAGEAEVKRVPVKALMDLADPAFNLKLVGGEEIRVSEVAKIFVAGNVNKPGVYPMQDNSDTTLLKALALSEGVKPYSAKEAYVYRRDPTTGKRKEIPLDLSKIIARKSLDVDLVADDILYIPENHGRKLAGAALDRIAGTGSSVATALAYHY